MREIVQSYGVAYNPSYVRVSTRGVDGVLVVTVQALLVDCNRVTSYQYYRKRELHYNFTGSGVHVKAKISRAIRYQGSPAVQ